MSKAKLPFSRSGQLDSVPRENTDRSCSLSRNGKWRITVVDTSTCLLYRTMAISGGKGGGEGERGIQARGKSSDLLV